MKLVLNVVWLTGRSGETTAQISLIMTRAGLCPPRAISAYSGSYPEALK